jgi:hypothetical protein
MSSPIHITQDQYAQLVQEKEDLRIALEAARLEKTMAELEVTKLNNSISSNVTARVNRPTGTPYPSENRNNNQSVSFGDDSYYDSASPSTFHAPISAAPRANAAARLAAQPATQERPKAGPLYNGVVKLFTPKPFEGRPGTTHMEVEHFFYRVERFLKASQIDFESIEALNLAMLSLDGDALSWFQGRELCAINGSENLPPINSWIRLKEEIRARFVPLAQESLTMSSLIKTKYISNVESYNAVFNRYLQLLPQAYNPNANSWIVGLYMQGLESAPADIITAAENALNSNNLTGEKRAENVYDLQNVCILAERIWKRAHGNRAPTRSSGNRPNVSPSVPGRTGFNSWRSGGNYSNNRFNSSPVKSPSFSTPVKPAFNHIDADDEIEESSLNNVDSESFNVHEDPDIDVGDADEEVDVTLNAIKFYEKQKNRNPKLDPEEFNRRRKNNTCFHCNQPGHYVNDCFAFKKTQFPPKKQ